MIRTLVAVTLAVAVQTGCASEQREPTRQLILLQHEIWSTGNLELVSNVYTTGFVGHFPGREVQGYSGIGDTIQRHRTAFPDWKETMIDFVFEEDRAVSHFRSQGTNNGSFLGNPATGNAVEISELAIYRIENGLIAEQWVFPDIVSMQQQLAVAN